MYIYIYIYICPGPGPLSRLRVSFRGCGLPPETRLGLGMAAAAVDSATDKCIPR